MTTDANDAPASFLLRYQRKIALAAAAWLAFMQAHSAEPDAVERELENVMMAAQQALAEPTAYAAGLTLVMEAWRHMELRGHWLLWQDILRAAVAVATEMKAASHTARLHDQLAETERLLGNNPAALAQFETALAAALQADDMLQAGRILSHMSQVQLALGHLDAAEASCKQALAYVEGFNSPNDLGRIYNNWGLICQECRDLEQALVYYDLAEVYFEQVQNRRGIGHIENNRGDTYRMLQRYAEAESHIRNALTFFQELEDELCQALALNNLSIVLFKQKLLVEALSLNIACETKSHRLHNIALLARVYNNRGLLLAEQAKTREAQTMFEESAALHLKNSNRIYAIDTLHNCIEMLLDSGNNMEAINNLLARIRVLFSQLTDTPLWLTNDYICLISRLATPNITAQPSQE
ncbi:MAG: tetratricopeptide repeat protein [Anaerolineae bacterium]